MLQRCSLRCVVDVGAVVGRVCVACVQCGDDESDSVRLVDVRCWFGVASVYHVVHIIRPVHYNDHYKNNTDA